MTTHVRLRVILTATTIAAAAFAGTGTAYAGAVTTATPTETTLSDLGGYYTWAEYEASWGSAGTCTGGTDVGFAAWNLAMQGVRFDSQNRILGPAHKTAVLGAAAYAWPAAAKTAGETVTTTAAVGDLAVWARSAKVTTLNQNFSTAAVTKASATTGAIGLVTGLWSNGSMVVDTWNAGTQTTELVSAKGSGLSFIKPAASADVSDYTLTVKNAAKTAMSITVAQPGQTTPGFGYQQDVIAAGGSQQFVLTPLTLIGTGQLEDLITDFSYLTPTYTITNGSKKEGTVAATSGGAKTLTLKK